MKLLAHLIGSTLVGLHLRNQFRFLRARLGQRGDVARRPDLQVVERLEPRVDRRELRARRSDDVGLGDRNKVVQPSDVGVVGRGGPYAGGERVARAAELEPLAEALRDDGVGRDSRGGQGGDAFVVLRPGGHAVERGEQPRIHRAVGLEFLLANFEAGKAGLLRHEFGL